MERITIVGMGPLGTSLGLALKQKTLANTELMGTSGDRKNLAAASKIGAVDQASPSLGRAVEGAKLVVLDVPISDTRAILEAIGPILDNGCVVTDLGSIKTPVLAWAEEYFPSGVSFVGGHPLPKKAPLALEFADAALFQGIDYCVIPAKSARREAVSTVVDLVEAVGAKPLFMGAQEHDSYSAAMQHLPAVLSSAFVTATSGSQGWRDMHRLAASEFSDLSQLASNDPRENEAISLANPDALVHWLDEIIGELYAYRNQIKERSEDLLETFARAWEARARWEANAVADDNLPGVPTVGQNMGSFLLGDRLAQRFRQMTESEDKKKLSWRQSKRR